VCVCVCVISLKCEIQFFAALAETRARLLNVICSRRRLRFMKLATRTGKKIFLADNARDGRTVWFEHILSPHKSEATMKPRSCMRANRILRGWILKCSNALALARFYFSLRFATWFNLFNSFCQLSADHSFLARSRSCPNLLDRPISRVCHVARYFTGAQNRANENGINFGKRWIALLEYLTLRRSRALWSRLVGQKSRKATYCA